MSRKNSSKRFEDVKNYVLVGFMGSGKSTVGIRLSYKLKRPYIDTDKFIEEREGRTILQIFEDEGEAEFRSMETECIRDIATTRRGYIISTGGGTPMRTENRKILKHMGLVVYLRCRPETVYARVGEDRSRPLLQTADPLGRIREMMAERDPVYRQMADLIVDTDDKLCDEIAEEIIMGVNGKQK